MKKLTGPIFIVALLIFCLWQFSVIRSFEKMPSHRDMDRPYIDRATRLWAIKIHESPKNVTKNRYAVAVHFPNKICIQLTLAIGSLGGNPTYCFERESYRLLEKYDDVE